MPLTLSPEERRAHTSTSTLPVVTASPGDGFSAASGQAVWKHHIRPVAHHEKFGDPQPARASRPPLAAWPPAVR
jgi:hypothetical protein